MNATVPRSAPDTDPERLRFRRQFFLGPTGLFAPAGWSRQRLDADRSLVAHPDLALTQVRRGARVGTLIGFWFDPARPQASDRDTLHRLLDQHQGPAHRDGCARRALGLGAAGRAAHLDAPRRHRAAASHLPAHR
jgi:hypothetical protein